MTATIPQFNSMLESMGSDVTYHRESGGEPCPCLTPEGFRDPAWHKANPEQPVCNEQGVINQVILDAIVKASVQPVRSLRRQEAERVIELVGEVQSDDQLGVFPVTWNGTVLNFFDWDDSGANYVEYDGRRFLSVNADKLPDVDGDPNHHWEVGLRLIREERPNG